MVPDGGIAAGDLSDPALESDAQLQNLAAMCEESLGLKQGRPLPCLEWLFGHGGASISVRSHGILGVRPCPRILAHAGRRDRSGD